MVDSQPMEEEFQGAATREVGMEPYREPTEPVLQKQKTPSPSPAFIKENIDVLRTMIKEHDQQAKMKATPRKLAYADSNKEALALSLVKGFFDRFSLESSDISNTYRQTRSTSRSQKTLSRNKEPAHLRRSRRLEDRSITKEKVRKERSKSKIKRPGHQEANSNSEYEEGGQNSLGISGYTKVTSIWRITWISSRQPPSKGNDRTDLVQKCLPNSMGGCSTCSLGEKWPLGQQKWFVLPKDTKGPSSHRPGMFPKKARNRAPRESTKEYRYKTPYPRKDTFNPLIKTLKEILTMESVSFPKPSPLIGTPEKQNLNKLCDYHGDRGSWKGCSGVNIKSKFQDNGTSNLKSEKSTPKSMGSFGVCLKQQQKQREHRSRSGRRRRASIVNRISIQMFPPTSEGIQPYQNGRRGRRKDRVPNGIRSILFYSYVKRTKELRCYTSKGRNSFNKWRKFLGHMVTEKGLRGDPERIQAIILIPTPRSPNQIRSLFLQLTAISKFISKLAELKHPLREARTRMETTKESVWTNEAEEVLQRIKRKLGKFATMASPQKEVSVGIKTRPSVEETSSSNKGKAASNAPRAEPNYNGKASGSTRNAHLIVELSNSINVPHPR
ncbi:hypothetical protein Tco_0810318 [Tanacetum coccineum]